MKGYKYMYDYRGKVAGMIIAGVGLPALVIQKLTHFTVSPRLSDAQHFNLLLWITLLGLFTMMFSYEKYEDERIKLIRAKAFMIVFALMTGSILAFAFTVTLQPSSPKFEDILLTSDDVIMAGRMMMFYPAVAIVIYLILFHIGVYFDQAWDYKDNVGFIENLKRNKWRILLMNIVGILIISLIYFLFV